jgi:gas vesicle protein
MERRTTVDDIRAFGGFLIGFVLGGLIGLAMGILMAPQSGEETRTQLREKGIELKVRAEDLTEEGRARLQEAYEEGMEAAAKKREDLTKRLEAEKEPKKSRAKKAKA